MPEGTPIQLEVGIGPVVSVRANIQDLYFIPTSERLIINPTKEEGKLFQLADTVVQGLLKTLPYTPILAIGYNFAYELEGSEKFAVKTDFTPSCCKDIYSDIGAMNGSESIMIHSLVLADERSAVLNISFKFKDNKKYLNLNYHYQVDNDSEKIQTALGKFYKSYQHAKIASAKLISKQ